MNQHQANVFEDKVIAAMTSGIKQDQPTYQLPRSMALEYGRLCYNIAISDVIMYLYELGQRSPEHLLITSDIADALVELHIKQGES
jgi:hypothetical protein